MSLFKFNVVAGSEDVLLKGMMFTLQQGTYQNAVQYELFRAGTTDTVASAIPDDSNTLTFYKAGGLGGVLVAGTPVTFEVRALSATAPAADPKLQIRFLTSATNYIIGMAGGTILKDIRTNDVSIFPCDINVKTLPATLWTLSTSQ